MGPNLSPRRVALMRARKFNTWVGIALLATVGVMLVKASAQEHTRAPVARPYVYETVSR